MKKNLLIVDDEHLLVKNMSLILQPHASQIFKAYNGKEGLEILRREVIHCVICDITMPEMNGVEFIRESRHLGITVPFIFYTAYGNHEFMLEVAQYGAFDFLRKPDFIELERIVVNGLNEGFDRLNNKEASSESFMSEYQLLLEKLNQQTK
jgi:YesN/AraC family two-component response regulator